MAQSGFTKVADVGELSPGDMKSVEVGNDQILLINHEGNIYACDDICSHAYASLSEGDLAGEEIECPLHGGRLDVRDGSAVALPIRRSAESFPVRLDGARVEIGLPSGG